MRNYELKHIALKFIAAVILLLITAIPGFGQQTVKDADRVEVNLKIVSAEVIRFEKPIVIGPGKRGFEYREALVLKVQVDGNEFDSLPPSIEPFLYIGKNEYRIFHITRNEDKKDMILEFHILNWEEIKGGEPIVLTTEHGDPVRDPKKYLEKNLPRFEKRIIVDKR